MKHLTREQDAATLLCPSGWRWFTNDTKPRIAKPDGSFISELTTSMVSSSKIVHTWTWGTLVYTGSVTHTQQKLDAYGALLKALSEYYVYVSIKEWTPTKAGVNEPSIPRSIQLKPQTKTQLDRFTRDYGPGDGIPEEERTRIAWYNYFSANLGSMLPLNKPETGKPLFAYDSMEWCANCHRIHGDLEIVEDAPPENAGKKYCRWCVLHCPGAAGEPCGKPYIGRWMGCSECWPRYTCTGCNQLRDERTSRIRGGVRYCSKCITRVCERCLVVSEVALTQVPDGNNRYNCCGKCKPQVQEWLRGPKDERIILEKPCSMRIPDVKERPTRLCSVELEIDAGAGQIIEDLYNKGFASSPLINGYHAGGGFCYMERDGSLHDGGGELIVSKAILSKQDEATRLRDIVGIVRKYVKSGGAEINLRCGLHVHIDAHKMGAQNVRNVVILTNYLEDVLFRLSASAYSRHRGMYYAQGLPKEKIETLTSFNRNFWRNNGHHDALNASYYYRAAKNDPCGRMLKQPERCACDLGKCTLEFRMFNGTASWQKLHAYIAICMSIVAYANTYPGMLDVAALPPTEFNPIELPSHMLHNMWMERLTWMFRNLWFSPEERDSIQFTIHHSDMRQLGAAIKDVYATPYMPDNTPPLPVEKENAEAEPVFDVVGPGLRMPQRFDDMVAAGAGMNVPQPNLDMMEGNVAIPVFEDYDVEEDMPF